MHLISALANPLFQVLNRNRSMNGDLAVYVGRAAQAKVTKQVVTLLYSVSHPHAAFELTGEIFGELG